MFSKSRNPLLIFLLSYHVWVTSKIQVNFQFDRYWWFCFNGVCLNPDKSESILFGTHHCLRTFPAIPPFKISGTEIKLSDNITSLGIIMDSKLLFNAHVTALCKACYFHFRSIRHIRRSLTDESILKGNFLLLLHIRTPLFIISSTHSLHPNIHPKILI